MHCRDYHTYRTHTPRDVYIMCVRVYTDLYILSSFSLEPRCSLVYPRRNVEFKRITETRRRGEEANNIHPLLPSIRFTRLSSRHVLKPKSFFYFKLHTCLVRVVSSISPSSWYREPVVCTERYSHTHPHTDPRARSLASSRATHEKRERAPATSPLPIIHLLGTSATICLLCKSRLTGADVDRRRQRRRVTAPDRLRVDGEYLSLMHSAARG